MLSLGSCARRLVKTGGVLVALNACTSSTSTVQVRTDGRLRVTPQEFTYDVGCSFASGTDSELGYYAATLVDLGDADAGAEPKNSGSATAARCTSSTTFSTSADKSLIEIGHRYAVIIDGYVGNTPPKLDGARPGKWAQPTWQWLCGIGGLSETQLHSLVAEAELLTRAQPAAPVHPGSDAGSSTAPAPTDDLADAAMTPSTTGSTIDAAVTSSDATVTSSAAAVTSSDAAVTSSDAGTSPASTSSAATVPSSDAGTSPASTSSAATVPSSDAGTSPVSTSSDAAVTSSDATVASSDAGTSPVSTSSDAAVTSSDATVASSDAGTSPASTSTSASASEASSTNVETQGPSADASWLALVAAAADDDFAPPAEVVAGGQSGLRGCVPLF